MDIVCVAGIPFTVRVRPVRQALPPDRHRHRSEGQAYTASEAAEKRQTQRHLRAALPPSLGTAEGRARVNIHGGGVTHPPPVEFPSFTAPSV